MNKQQDFYYVVLILYCVNTKMYYLFLFWYNAKISKKLEMSFNKIYINAYIDKFLQLKIAALLIVIVIIICSSCSTSNNTHRFKKRKKKDCDCSEWSHTNYDSKLLINKVAFLVTVEKKYLANEVLSTHKS